MESYPIYNAITKHWPKIATVIVIGVSLAEFVLDSVSADSTLEWYFLAWGGLTGGIWFIFDAAEKATPAETSRQLAQWIKTTDIHAQFEALPDRFAALFDLIFGKEHFTFHCFRRSIVVSIISSWFVGTIVYSVNSDLLAEFFPTDEPSTIGDTIAALGLFGVIALFTNLIPDYLSLLQTRFMIKLAQDRNGLLLILFLDALVTGLIFLVYVCALAGFITFYLLKTGFDAIEMESITSYEFWVMYSATYIEALIDILPSLYLGGMSSPINTIVFVTFATTFFTSVWLWLYMLAAFVSRILLHLNSQVGFLIKAVDVDSQPFRSLGFVSVILISGIFMIGLPFTVW